MCLVMFDLPMIRAVVEVLAVSGMILLGNVMSAPVAAAQKYGQVRGVRGGVHDGEDSQHGDGQGDTFHDIPFQGLFIRPLCRDANHRIGAVVKASRTNTSKCSPCANLELNSEKQRECGQNRGNLA